MNAGVTDPDHPSYIYYDSDYPSRYFPVYPENFDGKVYEQGIADDVENYIRLSERYGKKILELCCGTGRIAIPLVLSGGILTAIDIAQPLIGRFRNKVRSMDSFPLDKLTILKKDVTTLALSDGNFDLVICGFNSLLCVTDFNLQQQTLNNAARHLKKGGLLVIDLWNPLAINLHGDTLPELFFTRHRTDNGNTYSRFAGTGPVNEFQVQSVFGWYEEISKEGSLIKTDYHLEWRLLFPYEIRLMLEKAGLQVENFFGGNNREPFRADSPKMVIEALKI